ncbi:sensor histidine kinase [Kitasatospora sp. CB01950]|uniref:sensor histidine kinase n=1 Tax=Kitasatospora sp. CB01950 TaxID=1703930 RepID=UPI00093B3346|nr:histidine kinase [Kitasatospora sp. CB01950]OKJ00905.1 histidine kinase [Kitasatospora sp. CB01950]
MTRGFRPLLRGSTYSGALFAFCAAPASLVLLPLAAIPAVAWASGLYEARAALTVLVWAVLVAALGLPRISRRALAAGARRLLAVRLPDVPAPAVGGGRWRTPLWLVAQVALGWVGGLSCLVLLLAAVSLPNNWLDGEARLSWSGRSVQVTGVWSWPVAAVCLLLVPVICAAVAGFLRRLAPALLGPSAAERLALASEQERRLAERNRLAHELHDSIGHTLTATTIQAAVAGEVLSADPVAARAALRSIEESTRAALEDLDYVLGVLREDRPGTAPTRTLADLPELLERLRHAGAVLEPELSGELTRLQGTLSRAAYRILQEGLTNALRHGAGGPVEVRVTAGPELLELSVVNRTGAAASGRAFPTSGHGLPGLAERVRLLNGEFEAGPDGPEHWRLAVRLPVRWSA